MSERVQTATLIARVAHYRASGMTWEQVAEKVGKTCASVRNMPSKRRDEWAAEYAKAHTEVVDAARDEAIAVLRDKLGSDREDIQVRAAEAIWSVSVRERPPTQRVQGAMTFEAIMPHREEADGS